MSYAMRRGIVSVATSTMLLASHGAAAQADRTQAAQTLAASVPAAATLNPAQATAGSATGSASGSTAAYALGTKPLDLKTLASTRGGTDVFNDMQLKGVVADNRAVNVTTGNNVISDGAFAGAAGLPMVIQNSGNNVLIQNATIVNVQVK